MSWQGPGVTGGFVCMFYSTGTIVTRVSGARGVGQPWLRIKGLPRVPGDPRQPPGSSRAPGRPCLHGAFKLDMDEGTRVPT